MRARWSNVFVISALLLLFAAPASARDTEVILDAKAAAESEQGKAALLDIPFYMKGQEHPEVVKKLIQVSANRSTRGVFRSDEDSCRVAFLSAMIVLQERAQTEGGDALVDVVSITRGKLTESPTEFRCIAGSTVVHVGLKAKIVKFK